MHLFYLSRDLGFVFSISFFFIFLFFSIYFLVIFPLFLHTFPHCEIFQATGTYSTRHEDFCSHLVITHKHMHMRPCACAHTHMCTHTHAQNPILHNSLVLMYDSLGWIISHFITAVTIFDYYCTEGNIKMGMKFFLFAMSIFLLSLINSAVKCMTMFISIIMKITLFWSILPYFSEFSKNCVELPNVSIYQKYFFCLWIL